MGRYRQSINVDEGVDTGSMALASHGEDILQNYHCLPRLV